MVVKQSVWAESAGCSRGSTSWMRCVKFSSWRRAQRLSGAEHDPRVCRAHGTRQHRLRKKAGHSLCLKDIMRKTKQKRRRRKYRSVHGSAVGRKNPSVRCVRGGAVLQSERGGDDNNMDTAERGAVRPPLLRNGLCLSEALG